MVFRGIPGFSYTYFGISCGIRNFRSEYGTRQTICYIVINMRYTRILARNKNNANYDLRLHSKKYEYLKVITEFKF
jgi:hypothetical protein